nr:hypothetical protein [Streptomyces sp. DSM 41633]
MRHPRSPEPRDGGKERSTVVLDVRGMVRATQQNTVAAVPGRRPRVLDVEVNAVAQSTTVVFDPRRTAAGRRRRHPAPTRVPAWSRPGQPQQPQAARAREAAARRPRPSGPWRAWDELEAGSRRWRTFHEAIRTAPGMCARP